MSVSTKSKGLIAKYFVLKPKSKVHDDPFAKASRAALRAYAKTIHNTDPQLAKDLEAWEATETMNDILMSVDENL